MKIYLLTEIRDHLKNRWLELAASLSSKWNVSPKNLSEGCAVKNSRNFLFSAKKEKKKKKKAAKSDSESNSSDSSAVAKKKMKKEKKKSKKSSKEKK